MATVNDEDIIEGSDEDQADITPADILQRLKQVRLQLFSVAKYYIEPVKCGNMMKCSDYIPILLQIIGQNYWESLGR